MPLTDKEKVTKVCIDDFALKKPYTYGTIMMDIDTHRIIDLLPSCEIEDVAEWLSPVHNPKILSRDGFMSYNSAIMQANYHYSRGESVVAKYQVTNACKGCGTCEKVCPTNNVHISGGRPVFGSDCLSCLACTQNFLVNVIRLAGEKAGQDIIIQRSN